MHNQCQRCLCAISIAATLLIAGATFAQPTLRVVELAEIDFEPRPIDDQTSVTSTSPTGTFGLNNSGHTVFTAKVGGNYRAFVALPEGGYGEGPGIYQLPLGGSSVTVVHDINDDGIAVGQADGVTVGGDSQAVYWKLQAPGISAWTVEEIDHPTGSSWSRAVAVSEDDPAVVVVHGEASEDNKCTCTSIEEVAGDFVASWQVTLSATPNYERLGLLVCSQQTDFPDLAVVARDIATLAGGVVGHSEEIRISGGNLIGACLDMLCTGGPDRAIHWDDTVPFEMKDIDLDTQEGAESQARGINASGNIAGFGRIEFEGTDPCARQAHFWASATSTHVNLGASMPAGQAGNPSHAEALNNLSDLQVVGWDWDVETSILWTRSGSTWTGHDLETLISSSETYDPDFDLEQAHDINDDGWIIVYAQLEGTTDEHYAWLLVPIADCPADLDGDGSVGFADLLTLLSDWGPCDPGVLCLSDIDLDESVGFSDLLAILNAWGPCPGSSSATDECADRDLGENCECLDTLTDLIENGTTNQSENARCWLDHYIDCHDAQGCNGPADCPDDDPCGNH